ncbi:type-F conjugative transfer system secretin TraK [Neisseria weixii]|uniref:TraK domain-containing protein n=1 Tax=Neisseria weixii TaxID=1853276 RepID=UPI000BB7EFC2|nr:type-F conjugative transfer system secretin TraK [Neisseria weixii]ATD64909.1 conjugal transfer protein TraK [Neisseria weixii]
MNKFTLILTALAIPSFALAEQRIPATEQIPHVVAVSKRDLSRIAIEGGRIASWKFMDGDLDIQKDQRTGQLFVRSLIGRPTNLYIISEEGKTYLLVLKPSAKHGDSIIIDEANSKRSEAVLLASQSGPMPVTTNSSEYVRAIKQLMTSIMNGHGADMGMRRSQTYRTIPLWKNTVFVQTGQYTAADMQAYSYALTNTGASAMEIKEQEFYRPGVYAVAAKKHVLQPGEMTEVYVIAKLGGD